MKWREDVLAAVGLDTLIGFVLAAPFLFSPPAVVMNQVRGFVIPLLQFSVIALAIVLFRKKFPHLTNA